MVRLSVNVNKVALLRNARGGDIPNVLTAVRACIEAGCHGITVHPRPDERHIRRRDAYEIAPVVMNEYGLEFNVEGYPSPDFLDLVCEVGPTQVTLVPDAPDVLTSNQGWALVERNAWLRDPIKRLTDNGIRVSLFVEPEEEMVHRAKDLGANRVELYTGPYAMAFGTREGRSILKRHREAALAAKRAGLGVNAGHDLNLDNLPTYVNNVPGLLETSIGQALIADALFYGLKRTVRMYLKALGSKPAAIKRAKRRPAPAKRATKSASRKR